MWRSEPAAQGHQVHLTLLKMRTGLRLSVIVAGPWLEDMRRLFLPHSARQTHSLDGSWTYSFPIQGTQIEPLSNAGGLEVTLPVPGVWESLPDFVNYRGQALAETRFTLEERARVRLVFAGVSHTCRVFLDGEELATHHNAYTPFAVNSAVLEPGPHDLRLWISNEYGEISALHVPNDYYNYGGISRPVELQVLAGDGYLEWVHFTPEKTADGWQAAVEAKVINLATGPQTGDLEITVAEQTLRLDGVALEPGENTFSGTLAFASVDPWTPDTPKLYALYATLKTADGVDDLRERVGFRTVETDGDRILLNGEPIFLQGFNRHEDHPDYGCAIPVEMMRKDLELCREMGANAMRTCHYPNDERFLDLCDEMGFLVWEENHARGLFPGGIGDFIALEQHPMAHPRFRAQCRLCNAEMVTAHFNHPSIVLWGILNECDSYSEFGRELYAEQFAQIQRLDRSRPATYASCHPVNPDGSGDCCQDLPDVCGWNFYFNWYHSQPVAEAFADALTRLAPKMDGKPMILSEFGGGAIPGFRDPIRRAKWSEERQADILEECLAVYLNHPRLAGAFVWQFCDVRVDEAWAIKRPRTMNNKGVVDAYRRPKLAWAVVKAAFAARKAQAAT